MSNDVFIHGSGNRQQYRDIVLAEVLSLSYQKELLGVALPTRAPLTATKDSVKMATTERMELKLTYFSAVAGLQHPYILSSTLPSSTFDCIRPLRNYILLYPNNYTSLNNTVLLFGLTVVSSSLISFSRSLFSHHFPLWWCLPLANLT